MTSATTSSRSRSATTCRAEQTSRTPEQEFALPNVHAGLSDVLRRYNNAVTLWHMHPSDSDLALVVGCLR